MGRHDSAELRPAQSFDQYPIRIDRGDDIVLNRHCEERSDAAIQRGVPDDGLLRFARNDG